MPSSENANLPNSTTPQSRQQALDAVSGRNGPLLPAPATASHALTTIEPAAEPLAVGGAPTFSSLWHAYRRRWILATLTALVGALAVLLVVTELIPGVYPAEAWVRLSAQSLPDEPGFDFRTFRDSQEAVVKGAQVLNEALNQASVPSSVSWLATRIKVDFTLGPEIMRLIVNGREPEEARKLANAIAGAYVAQGEKDAKQLRRVELERLEESLRDLQRSLQDKEVLLDRLRRERKLDDPEAAKIRFDAALRGLEEARKQLREMNLKEIDFRSELKALDKDEKELSTRKIPDVEVDRLLKDHPQMERMHKDLVKFSEEIAKLKDILTNSPVAREQLNNQVLKKRDLEEEMRRFREKHMPYIREHFRGQLQLRKIEVERGLLGLNEKKQALEQEVATLDERSQQLRNVPAPPEIKKLERDIELAKSTLQREGEKLAIRKLAPLNSRTSILQEAGLPTAMDRSRQLKFGGAAFLGTFCVLLLGVTLWEFRTRKLATPEDVSHGLGLRLLGTLPLLPARVRTTARSDPWWQSRMAEAVDGVRTFLLHSARADELRVVMVTSAIPGEGKTSLASQLAASLARAWRKTLLVDGDLRNPAAHRLFEKPLLPGLCEVLRGELPPTEVVQPTSLGRLWLMPAGQWDSHAVQALAQDGVRSLFAELKEQYDFVVVDSGPLLLSADSLQLGQHVDGVIFSVLRDVSQGPAVHQAQQKLEQLGVRVLGAVFVGAVEKGIQYGRKVSVAAGS